MDIKEIIFKNNNLTAALEFLQEYNCEKIYIAAGAVTQTTWNYLFNNDPNYGIDDLDFIFFNEKNLSALYEETIYNDLRNGLGQIDINFDIKNQARVHLWYENKFGYKIECIKSLEDSVSRFPTTATSIGIRENEIDELEIIAPFGLDDLLSGIVRPNKRQINESIYYDKVEKWTRKWPGLKVVKW